MEELFYIALGGYAVYSFVHLIILQKVAWSMRSHYQKFVSGFGLVASGLLFLGSLLS